MKVLPSKNVGLHDALLKITKNRLEAAEQIPDHFIAVMADHLEDGAFTGSNYTYDLLKTDENGKHELVRAVIFCMPTLDEERMGEIVTGLKIHGSIMLVQPDWGDEALHIPYSVETTLDSMVPTAQEIELADEYSQAAVNFLLTGETPPKEEVTLN